MVVLNTNDPSAHQTALRTRGLPMLTHNHMSKHSAFVKRLKVGSNSGVNNRAVENLANHIRGRILLFGEFNNPETKPLLRKMVDEIIRKREEDQSRFVAEHMQLIARHQANQNALERNYKAVQNNIAAREPNFRELLARIRNTPNNESLIRQRNARLNRNRRISAIKTRRARLRSQIIDNTKRLSEHTRQIQAWKWVRNHVVQKV